MLYLTIDIWGTYIFVIRAHHSLFEQLYVSLLRDRVRTYCYHRHREKKHAMRGIACVT